MRLTPNPYSWDKINLKLFYGRESLVNEMVNSLKGGHSFALVGGRRMGKTMLLRKLESELRGQVESFLAGGVRDTDILIYLPLDMTQKLKRNYGMLTLCLPRGIFRHGQFLG